MVKAFYALMLTGYVLLMIVMFIMQETPVCVDGYWSLKRSIRLGNTTIATWYVEPSESELVCTNKESVSF